MAKKTVKTTATETIKEPVNEPVQRAVSAGEKVVYVDNEGREYEAEILKLGAELAVRGGENGDWTVINVPHVSNASDGAFWKERAAAGGKKE